MKKDSAKVKKSGKGILNSLSKFQQSILGTPLPRIFMVIGLLLFAFIVQYFVNRPDFGTFLSSDMDPSSNVYILSVDENKGNYKVTKVLPNGATKFQVDMEKSTDENEYVYRNLEADSKGNFYVVQQKKDLKAVVADKTLYPTLSEAVLMYDNNGNFIKKIAAMDYSNDANPPTQPYIRKLQFVDQSLTIIACENNHYDIITANPLVKESPRKIKSFDISPSAASTSQSYEWVSDMAVLSSGRIFYSTLNGELFATNNQGEFENCSNMMPQNPFVVVGMQVDSQDNLYFSDCVNGKFFKLNTHSSILQTLYSLDSNLSEKLNVKMQDVRTIKLVNDQNFYAASKSFTKPFHVEFGADNVLVGDLRGALFPWGYLIMLSVILVILGIFYAVKHIANLEIKRLPLAVKMIALFTPFFVISMGVLIWFNTYDGVTEYMSLLRSEQERGAKIASDIISGSDFTKLNHVSGYMSSDYINLKNSLKKGYEEVSLKVGDRSDYIVTYVENYDKLYTTINTRYSSNSNSYDSLKYTNPDMISSAYCLVDYVLEQDEREAIYDVWKRFSEKTNAPEYIHVKFRDVYGDISAAFVPIKDTNGRVVGLVGNFLDEGIHSNREFWQIFTHASALVIIITILIIALMCLIVKWALRPLKKIESAIDTMSKGQWNTRIVVKTKDELADIAQAFNLMSEKIDRYTSNLIRLNKEYIRYVPTEIFKLMDKEKITQVELHDNKLVNINVVYISFNVSCKGCFDFNDEEEVFSCLNSTYENIFKVVEKNNGVVQSFDGLNAIILFPVSALDALNASIQFREINIDKNIKERMNITLGAGDVLIGVSGNEDRRGVIVVSDEIMQMFNIDSRLAMLGINHVATQNIIRQMSESSTFSYRFIGRASNPTDSSYTEIYQLLDGIDKYKRDLYLSTKDTFEKGIKTYLDGKFKEARKIFTDVLRVNEKDTVSIRYLMLCEEHINKLEKYSTIESNFKGSLI